MLHVVKRDGGKFEFNSSKITNAIKRAAEESNQSLKESELMELTQRVIKKIEDNYGNEISVENIQNLVERTLTESGYENIANLYANYRKERTKIREIKSDLMKAIEQIGVETDRDNANVGNNFSSKLLRIASRIK